MSNWKAGRATFSDEIALKVAGILELDPGYVLACIAAERENRPAVRQVWEKVAEGLALVLFGAGLAGAPPPSATGILHNTLPDYTLCDGRRRRRGWPETCRWLGIMASTTVLATVTGCANHTGGRECDLVASIDFTNPEAPIIEPWPCR